MPGFKRITGTSKNFFGVEDYAEILRTLSRKGIIKDISISTLNHRLIASAIIRAMSKCVGNKGYMWFRGFCTIRLKKRARQGTKTGLFAGMKGKKTFISCEVNPHFIRRLNGEM